MILTEYYSKSLQNICKSFSNWLFPNEADKGKNLSVRFVMDFSLVILSAIGEISIIVWAVPKLQRYIGLPGYENLFEDIDNLSKKLDDILENTEDILDDTYDIVHYTETH